MIKKIVLCIVLSMLLTISMVFGQNATSNEETKERPDWSLYKTKIGIHGTFSKMNEAEFDDVYGNMIAGGVDVSYMISEKFDVWLSLAYGSKTADVEGFPNANLKFQYMPIALDLRYYLAKSRKFDVMVGAGVSYYIFQETHDLTTLDDVKDKALGFNALVGTYYHLNNRLALQLLLRGTMVKKTMDEENIDFQDFNLNNIEVLFGISYSL